MSNEIATPQNPTEFGVVLKALVDDPRVAAMINQYVAEEFRRGYLHGKREMKMACENALASVRIEEI